MQLSSFRVLGVNIALFLFFSACSAIIPLSDEDKEDMVFVLGKWFYKNGKPRLSTYATEPELFMQCMTHFNSSGCNTKWEQRYWVREDYYKPGGPIFFQFGGEGPADNLVDSYYWHNYAQHYNAMLVVLEHRFYGESYPSRDNSIETLKLLTSQEALADAAYFIDEFTAARGLNGSNWVAFGGSYAGNLASWFKQKYNSHVKAAVSSSGPVLALYDFPGYIQTCSEVVKAVDSECYDKVYDTFNCMESLVNGSSCGDYTSTSQIVPGLRQCYTVDFGDLLSREIFFLNLAMGMWAGNWPSGQIRENCRILGSVNGRDSIDLYGNFLVETGRGGNCKITLKNNPVEEMLKFIRSEEGKAAGAAGWFWQTCYEFGYYMSSDPLHGLFGRSTFSGWPYGSGCAEEFGDRFTKEYTESRIAMTNEYYRARDFDGKCTVFVNGNWDPWNTLGITKASETSAENTVVYVPGAEHCDDMLNPKSDEMRQAQALIQEQIGIYLNDPNC